MEEKKVKKKDDYFGDREEEAIKTFLLTDCEKTKSELFEKIIKPCFKELIKGVLSMSKFQKIIGLDIGFDLEEGAYYHLIFNMNRFNPKNLGKDGKPAKAYSYYGTIVKNFILAEKIKADGKIARHGGTLDIDNVSEIIKEGKRDIKQFEDLKLQILTMLQALTLKQKLTKNDVIVLNCLKYMLTNWHKLDFHDKNQFNRLLVSYTQLPANVVMSSLKKIKGFVSQSSTILNPKKAVSKIIFKENEEIEDEQEGFGEFKFKR